MPCYDSRTDDDAAQLPVVKERLDLATRLLCGLCKELIHSPSNRHIVLRNNELWDWYHQHRDDDFKRTQQP